MTRGATLVLLCEDLQSKVFVERALLRLGHDRRAIRSMVAPAGAGSGEQYVRSEYPRWRAFLRARPATKALVVHVDADPTHTVAERHRELAASLASAGQPARSDREPIAELVPKRNVETWIHALLGRAGVDELTEYPKLRGCESACAPAAEAFADHARAGTEPWVAEVVPSLRDGLLELRRVM